MQKTKLYAGDTAESLYKKAIGRILEIQPFIPRADADVQNNPTNHKADRK